MTNERKNIMKSETVEEFKAAVAENGLMLSDEKAAEYFAKLKSGELSDEELNAVSGGSFLSTISEMMKKMLESLNDVI